MANRYWVGGSGTWDATSTTHWSADPAITFTASRSGTTLTTTGSPSLVIGMTVFASDGTNLGTITGGSGNTWTTSASGAVSSQLMSAATVGASNPTSSDDVFFTTTASTFSILGVTINPAVANTAMCNNISIVAPSTGNIQFVYSGNLLIYGNYTAASSNVTYSISGGVLILKGTSTGLTLDSGGNPSITLPNMYIDCGAGYYTLANNWLGSTGGGSYNLISGTLDTNPTGNYTLQGTLFNLGTSSSTRAFKGNYSNIIMGANDQTVWQIGVTTGLTVDMANATLSVTPSNTAVQLSTFNYGQVVFSNTALTSARITGAANVGNLVIANRASSGIGIVSVGNSMSINNITALSGTDATMRTIITGNGAYGAVSPKVITSNGSVSLTNVDFTDITANGTTVPWTGNNLGDLGGTSNITYPAGKNVYFVGTGNANWLSNTWSTTQGGTADSNSYPLGQDTVIFDATHPSSSNTITFNGNLYVGGLDTSARTSSATITFAAGSNIPVILGNINVNANTTFTGSGNSTTGSYVLNPRTTLSVTSSGAVFPANTMIAGPSTGNLLLNDNFTVTPVNNANLVLNSAILNLNNNSANVGAFVITPSPAYTKSINFGSSGAINLTGNGIVVWSGNSYANFSYSGTSNINLTYSGSTGTRTITSGNASTSEQYTPSFNITAGSGNVALTSTSYVGSLTFANTFTGNWALAATQSMYGNLTLSNAMKVTGTAVMAFAGGNAYLGSTRTITTNGAPGNLGFTVGFTANSNVTLSLQDNFAANGGAISVTLANGILDLNNHDLTISSLTVFGSSLKTLNLGTGNLTLYGSGTAFNAPASNANTTINPGTSNIIMSNNTTAKTFDGGGRTYYNIVQGGSSNLTLVGNNSFNDVTSTVANTILIFTGNTTTTVNNFSLTGNAGNLITIKSTTAGNIFNLSKSSGQVSVDYLSISDSNALGGATWYAGANSSNVANVTGWIFTAPPGPAPSGNGIVMTGGSFFDTSTGGITFTF